VIARGWLWVLLCCAGPALSGPVEVYRRGEQYCPQDRPTDGRRISAAEAAERAAALLPREFCGPTWFVSGCDFDAEWSLNAWRVYALQYQLIGGRKDHAGRNHSYVILDAFGNCLANIPGT
jgi:hypothetical protein